MTEVIELEIEDDLSGVTFLPPPLSSLLMKDGSLCVKVN